MKTTTIDKSKVKTFEDFQKLKWVNVSDQKRAEVYACISKVSTAIKKSDLAKKIWFSFFSMKEEGKNPKYSAHAVCVFLGKDDKFYWCDYFLPRIIQKPEDFQIDSANLYKKEAICGAMWEVVGLKSDDTPIFGEIKKVLPRKK